MRSLPLRTNAFIIIMGWIGIEPLPRASIIFSGAKRSIDVIISQITGITPYKDAIKLQRKNKQKPEYFSNINNYAFNYNWNDDTYFFFINGQIIKALIEGGLNKHG